IDQLKKTLANEVEIILQRKPGEGSPSGNSHDLEEAEGRLALLAGRTGIFEVGGTTDVEIKERMVRIENAYMSSKAALEEGVLAGGGVGLYNLAKYLDELIIEDVDQQQGVEIVKFALIRPLLIIASNSGFNVEDVLHKLSLAKDNHYALDTQTNQYGNFLEIGVIDSVKVSQLALRSAVSVIGTLITSDVVITTAPDLSIMKGYSPEWAAATREDPRA
ncbi:MAG: molecular chaperone GroEL, partial [Methylococcales bacterium]|nr:molecular chaperone GroEL [Methylococcales bacterium]